MSGREFSGLLGDPPVGVAAPIRQVLRPEPECDLCLARLGRVRGVDQVATDLDGPVAADRPRGGRYRIRGANGGTDHRDGVNAFNGTALEPAARANLDLAIDSVVSFRRTLALSVLEAVGQKMT